MKSRLLSPAGSPEVRRFVLSQIKQRQGKIKQKEKDRKVIGMTTFVEEDYATDTVGAKKEQGNRASAVRFSGWPRPPVSRYRDIT